MNNTPDSLPNPDEVAAICAKAGFTFPSATFTPEALHGLCLYLELLCTWGKVTNLVGKTNWRDTLETLVMDSFHLADFLRELQESGKLPIIKQGENEKATPTVKQALESWDLGSGAGLPGIPLRLLWSEGTYVMVEVRKKRVLFMEDFLSRHPLPKTEIFCGKAERFMDGRQANLILSRAFMPIQKLLPFTRPHLNAQSLLIIFANEAARALPGWQLAGEHSYTVRGATRYFWALSPLGNA